MTFLRSDDSHVWIMPGIKKVKKKNYTALKGSKTPRRASLNYLPRSTLRKLLPENVRFTVAYPNRRCVPDTRALGKFFMHAREVIWHQNLRTFLRQSGLCKITVCTIYSQKTQRWPIWWRSWLFHKWQNTIVGDRPKIIYYGKKTRKGNTKEADL